LLLYALLRHLLNGLLQRLLENVLHLLPLSAFGCGSLLLTPPVGVDDPPRLRNRLHLAFGARADLRRFPVEPVWVKALQQLAVPIPHLGIRRGGGNPEHLVPLHA